MKTLDSHSDSDDSDDSAEDVPVDNNNKEKILRSSSKTHFIVTDPKYKHNRIEKSTSKSKVIDPKYKHNRIEKSSSKSKVTDAKAVGLKGSYHHPVGGRNTLKHSRSNKKIVVVDSDVPKKEKTTSFSETEPKTASSLNLQSIVKFITNNKKLLRTDDFAFIRRKTLSDAGSINLPIVDKNVKLIKKANSDDNFDGRTNSFASTESLKVPKSPKLPFHSRVAAKINESANIYRKKKHKVTLAHNGSDERPETETYKQHSVGEQAEITLSTPQKKKENTFVVICFLLNVLVAMRLYTYQIIMPFYTCFHFYFVCFPDRVHSSSIVRQPSDRRPDVNVSLRSNGNASCNASMLNSSDLQSSFPAVSNTNADNAAGSSDLTTSSGSATLTNSLASGIGLPSISDLGHSTDTVESKDLRRDR